MWFTNGSGTGQHLHRHEDGDLGRRDPASRRQIPLALRYDGSGAVVGDVVMTGGHFGAVYAPIGVSAGTLYRSNIMVAVSQLDAGVTNLADLPTDLPAFTRMLLSDDNVGGGVSVSLPPMADSVVTDQLASSWRSGNTKATPGNNNASTAVSINLFDITLGTYTGTDCTLLISGIVGGVSGGLSKSEWVLVTQGNTVNATQVAQTNYPSGVSGNFTATALTSRAKTTLQTNFTQSGASPLDAQLECKAGQFTVVRD